MKAGGSNTITSYLFLLFSSRKKSKTSQHFTSILFSKLLSLAFSKISLQAFSLMSTAVANLAPKLMAFKAKPPVCEKQSKTLLSFTYLSRAALLVFDLRSNQSFDHFLNQLLI